MRAGGESRRSDLSTTHLLPGGVSAEALLGTQCLEASGSFPLGRGGTLCSKTGLSPSFLLGGRALEAPGH